MDQKEQFTTSRRSALKTIAGVTAGLAVVSFESACAESGKSVSKVDFDFSKAAPDTIMKYPFALPNLPYAHTSLEKAIDAQTMEIHHQKHHAGYTRKLNAALKDVAAYHGKSIVSILSDLGSLPESIQTAVRNSGGGYFNHALFWPLLSANGGGEPKGDLAEAIKRDFGSFDAFQEKFSTAAGTLFGSGWAWLVADNSSKLSIIQTHNQDTPLALGKKPVIGIDVWEHAYYLRYQNRRKDYIQNFWNILNWEQAAINYAA